MYLENKYLVILYCIYCKSYGRNIKLDIKEDHTLHLIVGCQPMQNIGIRRTWKSDTYEMF